MRKYLITLLLSGITPLLYGQNNPHEFDPPCNRPPQSSVTFTIPGIDNVPDLYGDISHPQLVIFFAGNQYMCIDSLVSSFKQAYPGYQRIFIETLPPGILARQIHGVQSLSAI